MRKDKTQTRVEKIYDIMNRGGYWSTAEITQILGEPKGTISPFMSALEATGNLLNHNHKYILPFPQNKSIRQIAKDVQNHYYAMRKKTLAKRADKMSKMENIVNSLFEEPKTPPVEKIGFESITAVHISDAIHLLKSNGYKILKPTTEFKEI
jgi:hypothetical protein